MTDIRDYAARHKDLKGLKITLLSGGSVIACGTESPGVTVAGIGGAGGALFAVEDSSGIQARQVVAGVVIEENSDVAVSDGKKLIATCKKLNSLGP